MYERNLKGYTRFSSVKGLFTLGLLNEKSSNAFSQLTRGYVSRKKVENRYFNRLTKGNKMPTYVRT